MKVLIVDDDDHKRLQIGGSVRAAMPTAVIVEARSYQSGLRALLAAAYDLVVLDMTMPSYDVTTEDDGGRTQAYAGREILKQMDARGISAPVIVVTQFERFGGADGLSLEELHVQLLRDHASSYKGAVFFDAASPLWRAALVNRLASLGMIR
ncbi:MAG TPA: response regulator [Thermoanaerobaculia bacterium]|nr:response regulator [Thermoanaerobaculia bacterium]